jgi:hypothetical protein
MIQWIEHLNAELIADLVKGSLLVIFLIASQGLIALLKFRLRRRYQYDTQDLANLDEIQAVSLAYFRRRQILDIIRAFLLILTILVAVLFYNAQAFSFLALALGAVVLNQKENINSVIGYFYLLANYNVGDDISIINNLGEIVRVGLFQTILAGKDASGEYNGKRVSIPNYQFLLSVIDRQDLKANTYRQIVIRVPYAKLVFGISFEDFLSKLRPHLDELLPKRNLTRVGSYRGFAGTQYKIDFEYTDATSAIVSIAFVCRARDAAERKENIFTFVESLKVT